jgi:hypothetical protein
MDPQEEAKIAALLIAQAQQLQDKAGQVGVTAFCGRPTLRERPNERFLTNTLRNVSSANRRVEERSMWAARRLQQQLDDKGGEGRREAGSGRGREKSPQQRWRAGRGLGQEWDELDHQAGNGPEGIKPEQHHRGRHRVASLSRSRSHSPERRQDRSPGQGIDSPPQRRRGEQQQQDAKRNGSRRKRGRSRSSSRSGSEGPSNDSPRGTGNAPVAATGDRQRSDHSSGDAGASTSTSSSSGTSGAPSSSSWSDGDVRPVLEPGLKVRGRGSVGSAVAVAGPYLPQPPQQHVEGPLEDSATPGRGVVGPERPRWLPGAAGGMTAGAAAEVEAGSSGRRQKLVPNTQFLRGLLTSQAGSRREVSERQGARSEDSSGSSRQRSRSRDRPKSSKRKRKHSSRDKKRRRKEGKRKSSSSKRDKKHKKRWQRSPDSG